jgi:hypothetical protein
VETCPWCDGGRFDPGLTPRYLVRVLAPPDLARRWPCSMCRGRGEVPPEPAADTETVAEIESFLGLPPRPMI